MKVGSSDITEIRLWMFRMGETACVGAGTTWEFVLFSNLKLL